MELLESLSLNTSVRMGGVFGLLEKFSSMEGSNSLDFKKNGSGFPFIDNTRAPEVNKGWVSIGATNITEIWGCLVHTSPNNLLLIPVFIFLFEAASTMVSCNPDDRRACGACTTPVIMSKAV